MVTVLTTSLEYVSKLVIHSKTSDVASDALILILNGKIV
jgi:hypothetical protein